MRKRILLWSCLAALLLAPPCVSGVAAAPPLPVCLPFLTSGIYPSPEASRDNTLFTADEQAAISTYVVHMKASNDRGLTWHQLPELPLIERYRTQVNFSANFAADRTLAVALRTGANISNDAGASWRAITFPLGQPNVFALADAQHLYLGYGREIPPGGPPTELLVSSDAGQTWQSTYQGLEVDDIAVSPAFAQDRMLLMSVGAYHYNGGLRKSTDAGLTWTRADSGIDLSGLGISSVQFSPQFAADHTLFVYDMAQDAPGVYKSTDGGATWGLLPGSGNHFFANGPQLLLSPRFQHDQTLWLLDYYNAIVSRDGGETWQRFPFDLWLQAAAEYCPAAGECGVELFGSPDMKEGLSGFDTQFMYHSFDYGETWQCLGRPLIPVWLPLVLR